MGPRAVPSLWVGEREVEKGLSHGKACKQESTGPQLSSLTACQGSCLDLWRTGAPAIKCQSGKLASTQSPRGSTTSSPHEKKRLRLISSFLGWDPDSEGSWRSPGPVATRDSHLCRLEYGMQVAGQSPLFARPVRPHVSAHFKRDINNLRNIQRREAACQMKDT